MPPVIPYDDLPDAVEMTLDNLETGKWIGAMTDLQKHVGFNELIKNKREKRSMGKGIKVRFVTDHNDSGEHIGLYNTVEYKRDNNLESGRIPWKFTEGHMAWDELEDDINSGSAALVDAVAMEKAAMDTSIIEICEKASWTKPDDSSDNKTPFGIPYWVTQHATLGYNGGNPSGYSAGRAGISSTDYTRLKNYTGAYETYGDGDATALIYMMEKASYETAWTPPVPEPGNQRNGYGKGIFTTWATRMNLKNQAKNNNDNLGYDLAAKEPVYRGSIFQAVPYLDQNTSNNPMYMLNFDFINAVFLKDWFRKKSKPRRLSNQPHVIAVDSTMAWNIECSDWRRQTVFYAS